MDGAATVCASGRLRSSHSRTWASACGWLATVRTAATPGAASTAKWIGNSASATATTGSSPASPSSVAVTGPSTEFSTGTHAHAAVPSRTAASAAVIVSTGTRSPPGASARAACSVNVPCGPK